MGEIREEILSEWERLNAENPDNATLWDAVVSLLRERTDVYLLVLKADINILRMSAEGHAARAIARTLGVPTKDVSEVLSTWGLRATLSQTLDFNPLMVYNDGMIAVELQAEVNQFMPFDITRYDAETIIWNVEKYLDLVRFLEENDK